MPRDRWLTFHDAARAVFEENPTITKERLARTLAERFGMTLDRSVFDAGDFAVRFASSARPRLSNAIVSFAQIKKYDDRPFLVCVLRPGGVQTLLANSTFIARVSHSSRDLSLTNIRGTILGGDILAAMDGIENSPPNFEVLFARHRQLAWEDNLARIVEHTARVQTRAAKYHPTAEERDRILQSVREAARVLAAGETAAVARTLYATVDERREEILRAGALENVNVRGNTIERVITGSAASHALADQAIALPGGTRVLVDIKSKLRGRASSPKLYNIDKLLRALSDGRTVVAALFVAVDLDGHRVAARLVNVLDDTLRAATRVQHHWASRASRGVTQLVGDVEAVFEPGFEEHIDVEAAERFVRDLWSR